MGKGHKAYSFPSSYAMLNIEHLPKDNREEKKKKAVKLHRQFAHASKEKLIKLLKDGGCDDPDFLAEVKKSL